MREKLVLVDWDIDPDLESDPIEMQGYEIPSAFKTFYLFEGIEGRNWSLELRIKIETEGTPRVREVIIRGLSDQNKIWRDGSGNYIYREPHEGVRRFQFETVEQNFGSLLVDSLQRAIQTVKFNHAGSVSIGKVRNISRAELKDFEKVIRNRVAKTTKTLEWAKKVLKIKEEAEALAKQTGTRNKSNIALCDLFGIQVGTAEVWFKDAKKIVSDSEKSQMKTKKKE